MAKSIKRVSISSMDKIAKERFPDTITEQWYDVEVIITPHISFTSMLEFVDEVSGSCFQDDGRFVPEAMDFVFRSNILKRYANFNLPDKLEHRYELVYRTDAVDFVCEHIDKSQLQEIASAANRKIDYMCDTNTSAVQKRMDEIALSFEKLLKSFEEMFSGVSHDDVSALIGALAKNGGIDEDKLVAAYLSHRETDSAEGDT